MRANSFEEELRRHFRAVGGCCEFGGEKLYFFDYNKKWGLIEFKGVPRIICIKCLKELKKQKSRPVSKPRPTQTYSPPKRTTVSRPASKPQPRYHLDPQNAPDQCMGSGYRFAPNNDEWRPF